ncbi:hypothetical protein A3860_08090 [Niastella vici]|uniref:Uncharacterized protein n=1 Tax=Niastella vici TaxID=1703345 RepID=A0A1V9FIT3_9BACT|nr:clostripain-related cysteine peptidase [Niastella vici]OQP58269.1 hypothetical protein A3860_08090 [Niastella vici]
MAQETVYDWKISIIAQYNKKWEPEYDELILAVKKQIRISGDKLKFIVFTYFTNDNPGSKGVCSVVEYYNGMPAITEPALQEPCDLYDPETLKGFFRDRVKPVKATWHTLILWGHGAGLGYFPDISNSIAQQNLFSEIFDPEPVTDPEKCRQAIGLQQAIEMIHYLQANLSLEADFSQALSKPVRFAEKVFAVKETAILKDLLKVISGKQLNEALSGLGEQKTEIVIASTCYCQVFEIGYYLKDSVSVLVAAETSIPISGFNYTSFFNKLRLLDKPTANDALAVKKYLRELAGNVVFNFHKKYTKPYLEKMLALDSTLVYEKEKIAISANDLYFYGTGGINDVIDELGTILLSIHTKRNPDFKSAVDNARMNCLDMVDSRKGIIDLLLVISFLKIEFNKLGDKRMDAVLVKLEQIRLNCNLAFLTSALLGKPDPACKPCTQNPQFLATFFPGTVNTDPQTALYALFFKEPAGSNTIKISEPWTRFVREFAKDRLGI